MNFYLFYISAFLCIGCFANPYCVVVDAYSSGQNYPAYFKKMGYDSIHVKGSSVTGLHCKENDFALSFVYEKDHLETLLEQLKPLSIAAVVAGSEPGVELAEELALALNLRTNARGVAALCRDKYLTAKRLTEQHVPAMEPIKVKTVEEGLQWVRKHPLYPVVVKPLNSGGADGFHLCFNEKDVQSAIEALIGHVTILHDRIDEVLMQPYLEGNEYIVNTVSRRGTHYIQSCMVYEKHASPEGGLVFETYTTLDPKDHHPQQELIAYTLKVLEALGITEGPTHCEIIMTKQGPILIECNARPHGHHFPEDVMHACFGNSHVELAALALLDEATFIAKTAAPFVVKQHFSALHLENKTTGRIHAIRFFDQITSLPSYHLHRLYVKEGDILKKTRDLFSVPGDIFLLSPSMDQIIQDTARIRAFENQGLFVVQSDV